MLRVSFLLVLATIWAEPFAREMQIGSAAELWEQRTPQVKIVFLEGVCVGLGLSDPYKLGQFLCNASQLNTKKFRFCVLVNSDDGSAAVSYVDRFYRNRNQTEIPIWAVIGAYNDNSCKEDIVSSRLVKLQQLNQCLRRADNMMLGEGISQEAEKAQREHCKSFEQ